MKKLLSEFVGLYQLQKTLRFELQPIGKFNHEEFIVNKPFQGDEARAEAYPDAKKIIDNYHKQFIEESLSGVEFDWQPLYNAIVKRKKSEKNDENSRKELEAAQTEMRKAIAECFKKHDNWNMLFKKELLEKILPTLFEDNTKDKKVLDTFSKFSTYFTGFHENRKNIYSDKEQATAISYRVVHDNFVKFIDNLAVYELLQKNCDSDLSAVEQGLADVLKGVTFDEMFSLAYFNRCLTQSGIDTYNAIIGGKALSDGIKIQGVNEIANLYLHKNPSSTLKRGQLKMKPLFKQILSDRDTYSFIPEQFESENELKDSINRYYNEILISSTSLDNMVELVKDIKSYDLNKIYVCGDSIAKMSQLLFGKWSTLGEMFKTDYIDKIDKKKGKKIRDEQDKDLESWVKKKSFSLQDIITLAGNIDVNANGANVDVLQKINDHVRDTAKEIKDGYITNVKTLKDITLPGNQSAIEILKIFLDKCNEMFHTIKLLHLGKLDGELDKDEDFYSSDFYEWYDNIAAIVPLYNKTRSFLTRKPADEGKMKLKFGNPTLADGWDKNEEADNKVIILLKDDCYYLAIMSNDKGANKSFVKIPKVKDDEPVYNKMDYYQIADATRDIPIMMLIDGKTVRKTGHKDSDGVNRQLEEVKNRYLPTNINEIRKKVSYKNSSDENFNKEDAELYIDYYKQRVIEYNEGRFVFDLRKPSEYSDYNDFVSDVRRQSYKIVFEDVPVSYIDELVENKKLFLFKIYNKDFATGAKGTPNMHTLYWKALFSDENLQDVIFKLNGGAEMFYRKKIIKVPVRHKEGSILINKRYKNGGIIPDEIYQKLYKYFNSTLKEDEEKDIISILPNVVTKEARFEIVKDKRYTDYKFLFHVSIIINFKADGMNKFNDNVNNVIGEHYGKVKVIGLDRGERNLIYLTLLDEKGHILKQKSFNTIETIRHDGVSTEFDYHDKLNKVEMDRDNARKSWDKIDNIKELKEGYVSQVVHQITKMMVEENAIVVMEDLNFGFKRGRFKVEKQVYQKFEKMLIDKLNYLVFKDRENGEEGSVLRGLQLANKFESFAKMRKQTGWLYYVPAGYTSKICPKTGFVNVFNLKDVTNGKSRKEFFKKMYSVAYNSNDDVFEFTFDYNEFKTYQSMGRSKWTVCTNGERIKATKENGKWDTKKIDLTAEMKELLAKKSINYKECKDLKYEILNVEEADVSFYKDLLYNIFTLSMQMRNSDDNNDYIISPIRDASGRFFDSRNATDAEPKDADANGAYHIALKGLMILDRIKAGEKDILIKNEQWFKYRQGQS